jgi:hypothetical protein
MSHISAMVRDLLYPWTTVLFESEKRDMDTKN